MQARCSFDEERSLSASPSACCAAVSRPAAMHEHLHRCSVASECLCAYRMVAFDGAFVRLRRLTSMPRQFRYPNQPSSYISSEGPVPWRTFRKSVFSVSTGSLPASLHPKACQDRFKTQLYSPAADGTAQGASFNLSHAQPCTCHVASAGKTSLAVCMMHCLGLCCRG